MIIKQPQQLDIMARPDLANSTGSILQVVVVDKNKQLCCVPLQAVKVSDIADNFTELLATADPTHSRFARYNINGPVMVLGCLTPNGVVVLNEYPKL